MKTLINRSLTLILLLSFTLSTAQNINKDDRKKAINLYERAMDQTVEHLKGMSAEQLNFKPDAESWSIAECIEHMALSETMFMDMIGKTLQEPSNPERASEKPFDDKALYAMITSRDQKVKTQAPLEPSSKWGSTKEAMKAYKTSRKETLKFIRKTDADLRHHYFEMPFGIIDSYQMLIFGAGHQMRHNDQISEIMNHPDFPAS